MSTNYEITEISPQQLRMQVKYTKTDKPDYWENVKVTDFSDDALHTIAKERAHKAEIFWNQIESAPADKTLTSNTGELKPKTYADVPDFDEATQTLTQSWSETDSAEVQSWTVADKSDADKELGIRAKRDRLLEETDHYGLSDVTMSTEMTTYRQALRDIPQQTDFPTTVTWPTMP